MVGRPVKRGVWFDVFILCICAAAAFLDSPHVVAMPQAFSGSVPSNNSQTDQVGSVSRVTPFAMEYELVLYSGGTEGSLIGRSIKSRRSDGTWCLRTLPIGQDSGSKAVRHVIRADGVVLEICDDLRIWTTTGTLDEPWQTSRTAGSSSRLHCGEPFEKESGDDSIEGYPVEVWELEFLGANQFLVRMTSYRAPDLGCEPLRTTFEELGSNGEYTRRWKSIAKNIDEREPPIQEFEISSGYEEVSPDEFSTLSEWYFENLLNLVSFGTPDWRDSIIRDTPRTGRPDFNGEWVPNQEVSQSGDEESVQSDHVSLTLAHNDPFLDVVQKSTVDDEYVTLRLSLTTDGEPRRDGHTIGAAYWDGSTLVLEYQASEDKQETPTQVERRMTLSPDGLTMRDESTVIGANGMITLGTEVWKKKLHPRTYLKLRSRQPR